MLPVSDFEILEVMNGLLSSPSRMSHYLSTELDWNDSLKSVIISPNWSIMIEETIKLKTLSSLQAFRILKILKYFITLFEIYDLICLLFESLVGNLAEVLSVFDDIEEQENAMNRLGIKTIQNSEFKQITAEIINGYKNWTSAIGRNKNLGTNLSHHDLFKMTTNVLLNDDVTIENEYGLSKMS